MYGWTGTILRVDLTKGKVTREATDIQAGAATTSAPAASAAKIIRDEVDPKTDALEPGQQADLRPRARSPARSRRPAGRYEVVTKGPLNGVLAVLQLRAAPSAPSSSTPATMPLIIEGKAAKPVYLWISDDKVEIRDAAAIWGHDTPRHDRHDARRDRRRGQGGLHRTRPASTSSLIANIMNEMHRAAGRTGVGAVMGSKNLKAVAVSAPARCRSPTRRASRPP